MSVGNHFKNTGQAIDKMISQFLEVQGRCPECMQPLYGWKTKKKDGTERCTPTCMACGFKSLKKKESAEIKERYDENLMQQAISMFRGNSVVPDRGLFDCTLQTYEILDQETKIALNTANIYAKAVLGGKPAHFILTGKSGSGKSHLAMGVCWNVMKNSNYKKKCLFINYRQLLEELKKAFNIPEYYANLQGAFMKEIKNADLVVIDDVGVELGGTSANGATAYNTDTLYSILDARQNEATIITTNLGADEIQKSYGDRILSRMVRHSKGYMVKFTKTMDKRVAGL